MGLIQIFLSFWAAEFPLTFYGIGSGHAAISSSPNLPHGSAAGKERMVENGKEW